MFGTVTLPIVASAQQGLPAFCFAWQRDSPILDAVVSQLRLVNSPVTAASIGLLILKRSLAFGALAAGKVSLVPLSILASDSTSVELTGRYFSYFAPEFLLGGLQKF